MLDSLFGNLPVIQKSLQGLTARERAIGENVANVDTPRYKRMEVSYEAQLRAALEKNSTQTGDDVPLKITSDRHYSLLGPNSSLADVTPTIRTVPDESFRNDGNNVDVELEMSNLAETTIRYNAMAALAAKKFEGIKTTLREVR